MDVRESRYWLEARTGRAALFSNERWCGDAGNMDMKGECSVKRKDSGGCNS